ncbi:MAG: hypothetical protein B7733_02560 [Myxococcales bacterium FL481]|nr:MAG: hypothetical protein B7733_02560 [Myxococcales bacterium FL481]
MAISNATGATTWCSTSRRGPTCSRSVERVTRAASPARSAPLYECPIGESSSLAVKSRLVTAAPRSTDRAATPHRDRPARWRWLGGLGLAAGLYGLIYYPWSPQSVPGRYLIGYLELNAHWTAAVVSLFEPGVRAHSMLVQGRFLMQIVLGCAALDACAVLVAAIAVFPASAGRRLIGVGFGVLLLIGLNVLRLVALYFAGVHNRPLFDLLHEEVFQFVMVAVATGTFLGWSLWAVEEGGAREHGSV